MVTVDEFMDNAKVGRKGSKLDPWLSDIKKLKEHGYTQKLILEFLHLNNVSISQTALNYFIKTRIDKNAYGVEIESQPLQVKVSNIMPKEVSKLSEDKSKAFNWQTPIAKEDLF
ncbi:MAG: hypothetical protein KBC57_00235 [Neisseriaceae bacterium]|nr:hypothetical protein [Neisseriaceae bacterium]